MQYRVVLVALAFVVTACSLSRSVLGGDGSSGFDASTERDVGPVDASRLDAPPFDGGREDDAQAPVDDGGTPDDAFTPADDAFTAPDAYDPSCTDLYRPVAPSYILCSGDYDAECVFYVLLSARSCADICGGRCRTSVGEGSEGAECTYGTGEEACDSTHNDEICFCARRF